MFTSSADCVASARPHPTGTLAHPAPACHLQEVWRVRRPRADEDGPDPEPRPLPHLEPGLCACVVCACVRVRVRVHVQEYCLGCDDTATPTPIILRGARALLSLSLSRCLGVSVSRCLGVSVTYHSITLTLLLQEKWCQLFRRQSERYQCNVETITVVMDAEGWSLRLATTEAYSYLKAIAQADSAHYPGTSRLR